MTAALYGLVLVGGQSRRMGQDKALLEYNGASQVRWTAELLATQCTNVYISCRKDQELGDVDTSSFARIHDAVDGLGPMGGLIAAHTAHPDAAWLAVACDLPRLSANTLHKLIASRDPQCIATAYAASSSGLPEPLCAIYEPASFAEIRSLLDAEKRCPRRMLLDEAARVHLVALPDSDALDNINTPDEEQLFRRS